MSLANAYRAFVLLRSPLTGAVYVMQSPCQFRGEVLEAWNPMEFHGDSEVAHFSSRIICAKNLGDCFAVPSYVRNFVQRKRLR
jgi:hypothetical protein